MKFESAFTLTYKRKHLHIHTKTSKHKYSSVNPNHEELQPALKFYIKETNTHTLILNCTQTLEGTHTTPYITTKQCISSIFG